MLAVYPVPVCPSWMSPTSAECMEHYTCFSTCTPLLKPAAMDVHREMIPTFAGKSCLVKARNTTNDSHSFRNHITVVPCFHTNQSERSAPYDITSTSCLAQFPISGRHRSIPVDFRHILGRFPRGQAVPSYQPSPCGILVRDLNFTLLVTSLRIGQSSYQVRINHPRRYCSSAVTPSFIFVTHFYQGLALVCSLFISTHPLLSPGVLF